MDRVEESQGQLEAEIHKLLHQVTRVTTAALEHGKLAKSRGAAAVEVNVRRITTAENEIHLSSETNGTAFFPRSRHSTTEQQAMRRHFPTHNSTHRLMCLARLPRTLAVRRGLVCGCKTFERYLDTVEVWGSSPHGPTILFSNLAAFATFPFCTFVAQNSPEKIRLMSQATSQNFVLGRQGFDQGVGFHPNGSHLPGVENWKLKRQTSDHAGPSSKVTDQHHITRNIALSQ
jgi:hypothetical protein